MSRRGAVFPFALEFGALEELDFGAFEERLGLAPGRVRVLCGRRHSARAARALAARIGARAELVPGVASRDACHRELLGRGARPDLVVGVGGGSVLDLAKFHASEQGLPCVAVPTILSNDGVASPISVLEDDAGHVRSASVEPPAGVLIDRCRIRGSLRRSLLDAVGDTLSNYAALLDWDLAVRHGRARPHSLARMVSAAAVHGVIDRGAWSDPDRLTDRCIHSTILSGLAMYMSGDSRPGSGAEHLLGHAIAGLLPGRYGHGTLVGSAAPFAVWLHDPEDTTLLDFAADLGFRLDFYELVRGRVSFEELLGLARRARGDRFTVLSTLEDAAVRDAYAAFLERVAARRSRRSSPDAGPGAAAVSWL